jgi:hypothetical protein
MATLLIPRPIRSAICAGMTDGWHRMPHLPGIWGQRGHPAGIGSIVVTAINAGNCLMRPPSLRQGAEGEGKQQLNRRSAYSSAAGCMAHGRAPP